MHSRDLSLVYWTLVWAAGLQTSLRRINMTYNGQTQRMEPWCNWTMTSATEQRWMPVIVLVQLPLYFMSMSGPTMCMLARHASYHAFMRRRIDPADFVHASISLGEDFAWSRGVLLHEPNEPRTPVCQNLDGSTPGGAVYLVLS